MDAWIEQFGKWDPLGQALTIFVVLIIGCLFIYSLLTSPFHYFVILIRGHAPVAPVTNIYNCKDEDEEEDEE